MGPLTGPSGAQRAPWQPPSALEGKLPAGLTPGPGSQPGLWRPSWSLPSVPFQVEEQGAGSPHEDHQAGRSLSAQRGEHRSRPTATFLGTLLLRGRGAWGSGCSPPAGPSRYHQDAPWSGRTPRLLRLS